MTFLGQQLIQLKSFLVTGKTPLFEVRRIDAEANDSRKSIPLPEKNCLKISNFTVNEDIDASADIEFDGEDLDHSPNWSKNQSKKPGSNISLKKQRLPVCIYTYKVNCFLRLHFMFSIGSFKSTLVEMRMKVMHYF